MTSHEISFSSTNLTIVCKNVRYHVFFIITLKGVNSYMYETVEIPVKHKHYSNHLHVKQVIAEGADHNQTPTDSEFWIL